MKPHIAKRPTSHDQLWDQTSETRTKPKLHTPFNTDAHDAC